MNGDSPDYRKRIVVDPGILAGKPVVAGTRNPVSLILSLLAHGYDFERVRLAYPALGEDDVRAAIAYASARLDREQAWELTTSA